MLWFTADHHFGHAKIIEYCRRPFASVEEMNEVLIERWNAVVRPRDTVWHLGDFCFRSDPESFLYRLNGTVWFCLGNHDRTPQLKRAVPERVYDVRYLRWNGYRFFLSHYSHRTWPKVRHGCIHLFGHSHGKLGGVGRSMDVGVDTKGAAYAPWSAEEVVNRMEYVRPHLENRDVIPEEV